MRIVEVPRAGFTEHWLTAVAPDHGDPVEVADRLYAELGAALVGRGIEPLQEKAYGPLASRRAVLDVRRARLGAAGADPGVPCTYVDGQPGTTQSFAGIQVWGFASDRPGGIEVRTLPSGASRGREARAEGFRLVHLASLRGTTPRGTLDPEPVTQIERLFANAAIALDASGLKLTDVARTWFYLAHLLDRYADFNRVRTAFYDERGLSGSIDERRFPASTGVQGTTEGEACVMDLLAAEGPDVAVTPVLHSARQRTAFAYGSAFSRASTVRLGDARTMLVSGTASIDATGRSLHAGDREAQVVETLLGIGALLGEAGATLGNVASATAFVKDTETLAAFRRVHRTLALPTFPCVTVLTDICRPELLFEMEAIAPLPRGGTV